MISVIFLDIDGVLMTWEQAMTWVHIRNSRFQEFKPEAVANLNRITNTTGAKIVISGTWRRVSRIENEDIFQHFKNQNIEAEVIDITPDLNKYVNGIWQSKQRGDEIQDWMDHNPVEGFVILDDDRDMAHLNNNFVHIKNGMATGLTDKQADKAIKILRQEND